MTHQSEAMLESNLIDLLINLGYTRANISNDKELSNNLKSQLEKHNNTTFSDNEFVLIRNHLDKGNIFESAKTLRDKFALKRDDNSIKYVEFMNLDQWCQNQFQVANQITQVGEYENRYDVTLLVNGLPLVQIELKRRGEELKKAFDQIVHNYQHNTLSKGLFKFVQIFVISNGVNTKYFANNKVQSFKQTFYWSDVNNKNITELDAFSREFLEPCHIAKMIAKYIVLNVTESCLMALRPYQYYATEAIIERVKNTPTKNGYIWHTTGSGKTLTSFKTSQILTMIPKIYKVVFVVDRKDLDTQTMKEFNAFAKDSVNQTDNTQSLVKQFANEDIKLIVTTIQKLNVAITKDRHLAHMDKLKDKKIIFIFDECHRSQFGETHNRIKDFFNNHQLFGFTGTPIFADNSNGIKTTKDLFDDCLHKYVINDAIKDENVLKFSVEYVGKYKQKQDSQTYIDIEVEDIDTKELLESTERVQKVVKYITEVHDAKTKNCKFNAMFCVSSIPMLIKYYDAFKNLKNANGHSLKIATIFSSSFGEDESGGDFSDNEDTLNTSTANKLNEYVNDYNAMYGTRFNVLNSEGFNAYFVDVNDRIKKHSKRTANEQVDILIVVNMLLTGFDSKTLNTLYVDKSLRYHGLIQAYSRTNRILDEVKSQGNIIVFRNLKKATDDAVLLFSNKDANEVIFVEPYEIQLEKFKKALIELYKITPEVKDVNNLQTEHEELSFVKAFRELMRLRNILQTFSDFKISDLEIPEQDFEDYKSKYLDLHDKVKRENKIEKVSILNDIDFEMELVHRDEINVSYIFKLLNNLVGKDETQKNKYIKEITSLLSSTPELRSKKDLIEKFINQNMLNVNPDFNVEDSFDEFISKEKAIAFDKLCEEERIDKDKLIKLLERFVYFRKTPTEDNIVSVLTYMPKILEREDVVNHVWGKIEQYIEQYVDLD